MKKILSILANLIRVHITLVAANKTRNIIFGRTTAKWVIAKASVTLLTVGANINIKI